MDVFPVLTNIDLGILEVLLSAEDGGEEVASADAANILAHRWTLLETLYDICVRPTAFPVIFRPALHSPTYSVRLCLACK